MRMLFYGLTTGDLSDVEKVERSRFYHYPDATVVIDFLSGESDVHESSNILDFSKWAVRACGELLRSEVGQIVYISMPEELNNYEFRVLADGVEIYDDFSKKVRETGASAEEIVDEILACVIEAVAYVQRTTETPVLQIFLGMLKVLSCDPIVIERVAKGVGDRMAQYAKYGVKRDPS